MDATAGALIVAALSVIATPITAWLTFRWGRDQERERLASERAAESERWDRDERKRRLLRGEEAALKLLEVVDDTALLFLDYKARQGDLKATYHEVRRLAELLTDDATRDKVFQVAEAIYYFNQAVKGSEGTLGQFGIANAFRDAAHGAIRAYLHDRPQPPTARFDRLIALMNEGSEMYEDETPDDWYDPLADPPDKRLAPDEDESEITGAE